jgi:outer membrane immunogenic protein
MRSGAVASLQSSLACQEFIHQVGGIRMRGLLFAAVAVLTVGAVNPTSAADILAKAPPPIQPPAPLYNWTGFYIGGNVGYGWSHRDFTNTLGSTLGAAQRTATNSGSDSGHGGLGGGQIGYNYQFSGNWVAGVEADIDAAHITSSTSSCSSGIPPAALCGTRNTDVQDFGTVRGRLGYAFNNVLLYGTGGWAWGHGTNTAQVTCIGPGCPGTSAVPPTSPAPASVSVNPSGWAAGGGVEWAFLPNWTLRADYLHLQFAGVTEDRSKSGFLPTLVITSHVSSNVGIDVVRVGVNYLFNWGAPPLAR